MAEIDLGKVTGEAGRSAYQIAVDNGFQGDEKKWLDSLRGKDAEGREVLVTVAEVKENMASGKLVDALVIKEVFQFVSDGKVLLASAITGKGIETDAGDTFIQMAENIGLILDGREIVYPVCIMIAAPPIKTEYVLGEAIDYSGMTVKAVYNDESEADITADCMINPAGGTLFGSEMTEAVISWIWDGSDATYQTIQLLTEKVLLISITVSSPTQTVYQQGDILNLEGVAVTAHYSDGTNRDVTLAAVFSPAEGDALGTVGDQSIVASYTENGVTKTDTFNVQVTAKTATWANATEDELADMLEAHYAGTINIYDYWHVGDERVVNLSAMEAGAVGETHAEQIATFVLMDKNSKTLAAAINGQTKCIFVVGQKNALIEGGYMNSSNTNAGGWDSCARRTWCNNTYRNALPVKFRALFKQHKNMTASGIGSSKKESIDYFALPSEQEILGATRYANETAESDNMQFEYYKTMQNRKKSEGDDGSFIRWHNRSPIADSGLGFTCMFSNFTDKYGATGTLGISPFGVI